MRKTCWDEFDVSFESKSSLALVGVDLGAGNCSAAMVDEDAKSRMRPLYFDSDHTVSNLYTAISFAERNDGEHVFLGFEANAGEKGIRGPYTNFKRPPGDSAKERYDGTVENPSYEALMRRYFQAVVQRLFDSNVSLSEFEHVILFVGRPASDRWCQNSVAYQKLLTEGMQIRGYDGRIDVMICSEAQAALAYEYNNKNISPGEVVLIVDCGCSTFDAVLVKDRKIIGEYSRQLGAGQIEELMYAAILAQGDDAVMQDVEKRCQMVNKKSKQLISGTKGNHIMNLRYKKEQYFGSEGDNGDMYDLRYAGIEFPSGRIRQDIDADFMKKVLEEFPVLVEHSYTGSSDSKDICYPSFVDATYDFLKQTQQQICSGVHVDRVILTGGASVMPFISNQVRYVFGEAVFGFADNIAQKRTREPAFSVGKGLAFMGYVEYLKRTVLDNCMEQVKREVDNHSYSIRRCITDAYVNTGWDTLMRILKQWKDGYGGPAMTNAFDNATFTAPQEIILQKLQIRLVEDNIGPRLSAGITDSINNAFEKLFDSRADYHFRLDPNVVASAITAIHNKDNPLGQIFYSHATMLGIFTWKNAHKKLSDTERVKYYDTVCRRESKVRNELDSQLWKKAESLTGVISNDIVQTTRDSLIDYLESLTPFFVKMVEDADSIQEGYL